MRQRLAENLQRIEQRIHAACIRAGRTPGGVRIIAITKYVGLDVIRALMECGVKELGESRVQALTQRAATIDEWLRRRSSTGTEPCLAPPRWHMVGHLQRNKVRALLPHVYMIHSVDTLRLAEEIDRAAAPLGSRVPVLIQINAAAEPRKSGVAVAAAGYLIDQLRTLPNLSLRGLMAMGPADDPAGTRRAFERVRELFEEIVSERIAGPEFRELSLGMSGDFEAGVECGATLVRIGSALFEGIAHTPRPGQPVQQTDDSSAAREGTAGAA